MKRKDCKNCFWADQCDDQEERCEYYYPLYGAEHIAENEYRKSLRERAEDYKEVLKELND